MSVGNISRIGRDNLSREIGLENLNSGGDSFSEFGSTSFERAFSYICMYVCMYVCMYIYIYICVYICIYIYIYISMHVYIHVRTPTTVIGVHSYTRAHFETIVRNLDLKRVIISCGTFKRLSCE